MNEAEFRAELESDGYTVNEVTWEAGLINDSHTHDFSAKLMCVAGSVQITTPKGEFSCTPGDRLKVSAGTGHREVVGPEGARLVAGRK